MNLKEFFDADEKIAIHCGTEEKAIKLCQAFQDMGKKWSSGSNYLYSTFWNSHKRLTCYTNKGSFDKKCWFEETGVKVIPFNEIEDFKDEIHITQTGNTIHAVHKVGGKVVNRKKAVCSPEDEFDFGTGARIAFNRLQINKYFADSCALEKKERTKNIANPIDLIAEIISKLTVPCKNCKWYYNEVCCNRDSDWVADFPPEYSSCKFGELKENI